MYPTLIDQEIRPKVYLVPEAKLIDDKKSKVNKALQPCYYHVNERGAWVYHRT